MDYPDTDYSKRPSLYNTMIATNKDSKHQLTIISLDWYCVFVKKFIIIYVSLK